MKRPPITLALGGGGARGVAHLGVIEVMLAAGFSIERIVGVSIGSLVGGLYAFEPDITRAQERALRYLLSQRFQQHQQTLFGVTPGPGEETTGGVFSWYNRAKDYLRANRVFRRVLTHPSLLPGIILQDVVDQLLPDADLADSQIPLSVLSVDLHSGHRVILENGPLRDAVRGSAALPGVFPPVQFGDMLLCDIGVFNSLPTIAARSYSPALLVAVDVSSAPKKLSRCETALDVLIRMDEIGESLFRKYVREAADVIVSPDVAGTEWFDFSNPEQLIAAGRESARPVVARLADQFPPDT